MRIAYVVGAWPSRSETFIAREIEALEARGHTVEVFPLWRERPPGGESGRPAQWCGRFPLKETLRHLLATGLWKWRFLLALPREGWRAYRAVWRLPVAFEMARRIRALGIERVHAQFGSLPSTVGWVAASLARVPFSFAVHARDVFVEAEFFAAKARAADRIIACNSAAARRARELAAVADRSKVVLVPHGLPLDRYAPRGELRTGMPLVLGVGRLVEKKGFRHLLAALPRLLEGGHHAACWLIGDGPERAALERQAAELGLGDAVEFRGWLEPREVLAAYARASVLAVPSVVARDGDMDGLPNVVLEAAATGLPIVATDVGGIGDLVRDGETGLVARPGDPGDLAEKIRSVLADPAGATARARRARQEVEARFDQAKTIPQLIEALGAGGL